MAGPLSDIRVLDFTHVLAGPFAAMVLADLGADVIKVERPGRGDESRGVGPFVNGESAYFISVNRGKQGITVNAATTKGRDLLLGLAAKSDVLMENFRPGTMAKLGLDYAAVSAVNPRIIYASISGFGQDGPYSSRPAYDAVIQAMSGLSSITGMPDGPPLRVGSSVADLTSALFAVVGILSALHSRSKTGRGQYLDIAMLDSLVAILENAVARYFVSGTAPGRVGSRHPSFSPFEYFETADGHLALAVGNDDLWRKLCDALGRPDLAREEKFETNAKRTQNYDVLRPILAGMLEQKPTSNWLELFERAGIPAGPVNAIDRVVSDPHVLARNMIVSLVHKTAGEMKVAGSPIKLSSDEVDPTRPSPLLGEHTEQVLRRVLGLDDDSIEELRREEVI